MKLMEAFVYESDGAFMFETLNGPSLLRRNVFFFPTLLLLYIKLDDLIR